MGRGDQVGGVRRSLGVSESLLRQSLLEIDTATFARMVSRGLLHGKTFLSRPLTVRIYFKFSVTQFDNVLCAFPLRFETQRALALVGQFPTDLGALCTQSCLPSRPLQATNAVKRAVISVIRVVAAVTCRPGQCRRGNNRRKRNPTARRPSRGTPPAAAGRATSTISHSTDLDANQPRASLAAAEHGTAAPPVSAQPLSRIYGARHRRDEKPPLGPVWLDSSTGGRRAPVTVGCSHARWRRRAPQTRV